MSLATLAADLLGGRLERATAVAGGDLSAVVEIVLDDGRMAVVKGGPAPPVEARMLRALAAQGVPTPGVLAHDDRVLVLERLRADAGIGRAWRDLGAVLARLHGVTRGTGEPGPPGRYGWHDDYAFGDVAIENAWSDDWPAFFGERRLANQAPFLPRPLAARVERLAAVLPDRLPRRPPPALLHGDLWAGNVLAADGRISGLIDPACYRGHSEVDLAMLTLFAEPGAELYAAYGTLAPGHEARRPIYQLWPAIVHLRLFGSGYRGMVDRMLDAAGV